MIDSSGNYWVKFDRFFIRNNFSVVIKLVEDKFEESLDGLETFCPHPLMSIYNGGFDRYLLWLAELFKFYLTLFFEKLEQLSDSRVRNAEEHVAIANRWS